VIDASVEDAAGFVKSFERDDVVGHAESMAPAAFGGGRCNLDAVASIDTGRGNKREADGASAR
jgi:hypothetical protein